LFSKSSDDQIDNKLSVKVNIVNMIIFLLMLKK